MTNAEKFEELLRSDQKLQEELRAATEAYDGDPANERAVFEATVLPLADKAGLPFTYDEALDLTAPSQGDSEKLSLNDLDEAAGGEFRLCIFVGAGSVGASACSASSPENGATGCAGIGSGLFVST